MSLITIFLALVVGVTLGLFGGGGAALTVPIFVYVIGVPAKSAVPMSFVVVGIAAAIGAAHRWRAGHLEPRVGLGYGVAAVTGAFAGARIGARMPARMQLSLFGIAIIAAALSMLRSASRAEGSRRKLPFGVAAGTFALIGAFTGMVGVGGGFLFVPALVVLVGVPMIEATGLSLMVIAMNATAALGGYLGQVAIDWPLALLFTGFVACGMLPAGAMAHRVPVAVLKRAFAGMLVAVGGLVLFNNLR